MTLPCWPCAEHLEQQATSAAAGIILTIGVCPELVDFTQDSRNNRLWMGIREDDNQDEAASL